MKRNVSNNNMDSVLDKPGTSGEGQESGDGPKKIRINPSNTNEVLPSSEKMQLPRTGIEMKAIAFVAEAHKEILYKMLGDQADPFDLSIGDQVHRVLFTSYKILRQRYYQTGGTLEAQIATTGFKVSVGDSNYRIGKDDILKIVQQKATDLEIPFARFEQEDPNNWYELVTPILHFLSGFALRRKELQTGHYYMPVEGENNIKKKIKLSDYDIYQVHHRLCDGVSFPPNARNCMPEKLGPLTALLCYAESDCRSSQKWNDAVRKAFVTFPDMYDVLRVLRDSNSMKVSTLINLIADVALIVIPRQATVMFPPPAAFSYIFTTERHKVGSSIYETRNLLETFDFSNHGAFLFYKIFMSLMWKIRLSGATDTLAKQIVYHSMFGTYKEDLGVLAQITDQATWNTLKEMDTEFKSANTKGDVISFVPVKQKFYSKMSQTNQTALSTSSYLLSTISDPGQISTISCFGATFSQAFFDYMRNTKPIRGTSLEDLIDTYAKIRKELIMKLKTQGKTLNAGTTSWYNVEKLAPTSFGEEEEEAMCVKATGRFFR